MSRWEKRRYPADAPLSWENDIRVILHRKGVFIIGVWVCKKADFWLIYYGWETTAR